MKLSRDQIETIQRQAGLVPVAEDDPIHQSLEGRYGPHTFYVDQKGIYIWQAVTTPAGAGQTDLRAYQIGTWANEWRSTFYPQTPSATENRVTVPTEGAAPPDKA